MAQVTEADIKKIKKLLEQQNRSKIDKILASLGAFLSWLEDKAYNIWLSVKNAAQRVWDKILDIFW